MSSGNLTILDICNKSLPVSVSYYSQGKAWMTGEILEDILTKLNRRLSSSNRNILLLTDNAGCHPVDLSQKFYNRLYLFSLKPSMIGIAFHHLLYNVIIFLVLRVNYTLAAYLLFVHPCIYAE